MKQDMNKMCLAIYICLAKLHINIGYCSIDKMRLYTIDNRICEYII